MLQAYFSTYHLFHIDVLVVWMLTVSFMVASVHLNVPGTTEHGQTGMLSICILRCLNSSLLFSPRSPLRPKMRQKASMCVRAVACCYRMLLHETPASSSLFAKKKNHFFSQLIFSFPPHRTLLIPSSLAQCTSPKEGPFNFQSSGTQELKSVQCVAPNPEFNTVSVQLRNGN